MTIPYDPDTVDTARRGPTADQPLAGLVVLDLSHLAAGPWCTMVLADMGADVIKVERPPVGDMSRTAGAVYAGDRSAVFLALNRNKRSIALDLKSADGREVLHRLARRADIVVENLRPGKAAELGADYDTLAAINPRLVYASVSAFGESGPGVDLPGNDPIIQAMSGAMAITGAEGGAPARQGVSVPDFGAGMMAGLAILAALHGRERTGRGTRVSLNLLDVEVFALGPRAQEYLIDGQEQPRLGSAHPQFSPYQAFECRDHRWFYLAVINDKFWRLLCDVLAAVTGHDALTADARFATNRQRVAHRKELLDVLEPMFASEPRDTWLNRLQEAGVPVGPVNSLGEAMEDPQVVHNEIMVTLPPGPDAATSPSVRSVGLPIRLDGVRPAVRRSAPDLGEHTDEVMQWLEEDA